MALFVAQWVQVGFPVEARDMGTETMTNPPRRNKPSVYTRWRFVSLRATTPCTCLLACWRVYREKAAVALFVAQCVQVGLPVEARDIGNGDNDESPPEEHATVHIHALSACVSEGYNSLHLSSSVLACQGPAPARTQMYNDQDGVDAHPARWYLVYA